MMSKQPHNLLQKIIADKVLEVHHKDVWRKPNIEFADIKQVSSDTVGVIGEEYIKQLLELLGHSVEHSDVTDRTQKHWDLRVNGVTTLEVKTATVGKNGRSFQHENIEKDRNYDALVLLDIAPTAIYLTVAKKSMLPFNQPNEFFTCIAKKMHRRAHGILYKWDFNLRDVEERKIESLKDVEKLFNSVLQKVGGA